ncbi:MAG: S8 family serine peptidase, partial [Alphaproteobacteria bacterium]
MRSFSIFALSFILSVQSVASAYAASSTILQDEEIIIQQNSPVMAPAQQRPAPQQTPQQPASSTPKKAKKITKKVNPEASSDDEDLAAAKSGNLVGQTLPYYLLGGLVVGGIIAAGGGGGGGGSDSTPVPTPDPTPDPTPPSDFETLEYNNQYGLGKIRASSSYARGYTGAGTVVAVIDSGFDTTHPDLAGNMLAGIDVVDNDGNVNNNNDGDYHGNWVSGVVASVRNGLGTHGVAYDAKILPIRAGQENGF